MSNVGNLQRRGRHRRHHHRFAAGQRARHGGPPRRSSRAFGSSIADDPSVRALVLTCAGRTFVSGAHITEFGTEKALARARTSAT